MREFLEAAILWTILNVVAKLHCSFKHILKLAGIEQDLPLSKHS